MRENHKIGAYNSTSCWVGRELFPDELELRAKHKLGDKWRSATEVAECLCGAKTNLIVMSGPPCGPTNGASMSCPHRNEPWHRELMDMYKSLDKYHPESARVEIVKEIAEFKKLHAADATDDLKPPADPSDEGIDRRVPYYLRPGYKDWHGRRD